ncbi:MAG: sporulation protein YlmC with PRC-barrel domain [bacterium]|jgi:sporulation protein YlmC with PRC-barrel domain
MPKYLFSVKILLFLFFGVSAITTQVYAMGGDSNSENNIPLPAHNFSVVVTDSKGVASKANRVSWNGKIYLQGKRGDSLTTVPFSKIQKISVFPKRKAVQGAVVVEVTLKKGDSITLHVKANSKCYGETSFGKFEIYIRDIKAIQF